MKKLFFLLAILLSLAAFPQGKQMIFWGNGKPCVFIGTGKTGSYLVHQLNRNYNLIISDTCSGKPMKFNNGVGNRPFIYFEKPERNIWIEYNNWFVKKYLKDTEIKDLVIIETTMNKLRQNPILRSGVEMNMIYEGLIWRAVLIVNDAYNRYMKENYGPDFKPGYYNVMF